MLLVVDAGNTNTVMAVHDGRNWVGRWRVSTNAQRTSDEYAVWLLTLLDKAGLGRSLHFTASPVMAGDRLVAVTEDAEVLVLDPVTPGKPLARHALGGMALATPAVSGGALFVRTQNELVQLKSR